MQAHMNPVHIHLLLNHLPVIAGQIRHPEIRADAGAPIGIPVAALPDEAGVD